MNEEEIINGCLGDGSSDRDWILSSEEIKTLPDLPKQDDIIFEYNQTGTPHCTLYSALGALSDLFNREITQKQIDETVEESYKRWRIRWEGWYVKDAVNLACDMWMKWYPDEKVAYYRISNADDDTIQSLLNKGYSVCTGFQGNSEYQNDREDNGQVDKSKFGIKTYWHAVSLRKTTKWDRTVKDNYKGRKTNLYGIMPTISDMMWNGTWHYSSYVIIKLKSDADIEKDIKRLEEMKTMLSRMIADNSSMWEKSNDKNYKALLHEMNEANRKKISDCERELLKYKK